MSIIKIGATCLALFTCGVASADDSDMMGDNNITPEMMQQRMDRMVDQGMITPDMMQQRMDRMEMGEAVRSDASTRISLSPSTEGLSLDLGGFIQTGYSYNGGADLDAEYGFSVDRARLILSGDFGKDASYLLSGQWSDVTSTFDLLDARVDFRAFDVANVRVGQFVPAFYSGFVTDPRSLITNNYSVSALTYGQGRGQGVELSDFIVSDVVELSAFYTNGFGDTNGVDADNDYAVGARASVGLGGGLSIGAGYAYNNNDVTDYSSYTVDLDYTSGKLDFNAAWIANNETDGWDNYSVVGTLAYQCMDKLQGFVQYEYGALGGVSDKLNIATIGCNYTIHENIVWTNTVGYAFEGIDSGFNTDNTGWRSSADDGQYVVRSVIQVSF